MSTNKRYFFGNKYSQGDVFMTPDLMYAKNFFIDKMRIKRVSEGFLEIMSPSVMHKDVWVKTGHLDYYSENMFTFDNYAFKPMSCPGATFYVKENYPVSYKAFPIKIFEWGRVYRKEKHGALSLLRRLNVFTQDDGHIFCNSITQAAENINNLLRSYCVFYKEVLGWDFTVAISTKPQKSVDNQEVWEKSTSLLLSIIEKAKNDGFVNNTIVDKGAGAFYGPKIDFIFETKGVKNKKAGLQLGTIQLDFFLAERLSLSFKDEDNSFFPIVVHFAMMGSLERFLSMLIEKNNNVLPFWCSPISFVFVDMTNEKTNNSVLLDMQKLLTDANIKFKSVNGSKIDIQGLLKENTSAYAFVFLGEKEEEDKTFSVRTSFSRYTIKQTDMLDDIRKKIKEVNSFFC